MATNDSPEQPVSDRKEGSMTAESPEDLEDFFAKPVRIGLVLFGLLLVPFLLKNEPLEPSPKRIESLVVQQKEIAEQPQKKPKVRRKFARIERGGNVSLMLKDIEPTETDCQYSIAADKYQFLSEESMQTKNLSGITPFIVSANDNQLTYLPEGLPQGCSNSFSFVKDKLIFSPKNKLENAAQYSVSLTHEKMISTTQNDLLLAYPKTQLKVKVHSRNIPDGNQTLVVKAIQLGPGKMSAKLLHRNTQIGFTDNDGRLTAEVPYQVEGKWAFIIASKKDFVLIDYIAFRDEKGVTTVINDALF